ncbi:MAG: transglycosylase SLT domain-containing protein [Desulfosarcinaceae bacterium]
MLLFHQRAVRPWTAAMILTLIWIAACPSAEAAAVPASSAVMPALNDLLKIDAPLTLFGEQVPLERPQVRERYEKELLLAAWDRPQALLWLKRSTRYLPFVEAQLKARRMPADLRFLAVAESALRPHVGSPKGALGFWQLLPDTARRYGLVVNDRFDERRNVRFSTRAALDYLQELHDRLGSWPLAAAAYNMGEEGLEAEMLEQGEGDFYALYLPLETQRFLFRILAAKLILSDPQRFGFHLSATDFYAPVASVGIQIDAFEEVPLSLLAKAAGTDFKTIKDLNPEIRGHYLAVGSRTVQIPPAGEKGFRQRYQALLDTHRKDRQQRIYVVQQGDNLTTIAAKFNVPLAALIIWNRIDLERPLQPGDRLVIHRRKLPRPKP